MVSTTDFDSVSLGSSPSSPTNLTNMEEIEKINIINKRLRQKEARADWKWVNDGKQFGWARGRSKNRKSKRGYEVGSLRGNGLKIYTIRYYSINRRRVLNFITNGENKLI